MKVKLNKIIGLVASVAIVASLIISATPVAADDEAWATETLPGNTNRIVPTTTQDVKDIAVAADGTTIYVASGTTSLFKSTDGGKTFTEVTGLTGNLILVAVAPDDANIVAFVNSAGAVYSSTTGGGTSSAFTNLTGLPVTTAINDIDISAAVSGVRYIAIAGTNAGAIVLSYFNLGSTVPAWTTAIAAGDWVSAPDGTSAANAVVFSPNFASDRVMVAVTETTVALTDTVFFDIASFASKEWDNTAGFADYNGTANIIATVATSAASGLQKASITMPPTYLGADEASRISFVGLATGALETSALSGVYRMTDEAKKLIRDTYRINSVSYTTGDKMVAGDFSANNVFRSSNPLATTPDFSSATSYQKPSGQAAVTNTVVAWAGTNVVAGTTGTDSAFAISADNGATFNDVSLIDALGTLKDVAVATDNSQIYLVTNTSANTTLWRKDTSYQRILVIAGVNDWIVRVAPEDAKVIYLFKVGGTDAITSKDAGEASITIRITNLGVADAVVESADVVYALSATGTVSKTTNAGFIWTDKATGLGNGFSLHLIAKDNLVAGGTAGGVAYTTDGNANWTKVSAVISAGNVHVVADGLATGNYIYAVSDVLNDYIYRWKIDPATTAWTKISTQLVASEEGDGIELNGGVLYVTTTINATPCGNLWRTLAPTATTVSFTQTAAATGTTFDDYPLGFVISAGPKLWAIDTNNSKLYSIVDTVQTALPAAAKPADKANVQTNTANGLVYDIVFEWARLSKSTDYQLQIALDSTFNDLIFDNTFNAGTADPVVKIAGPSSGVAVLPNTTYYWRIRATLPLRSNWSTARTFTSAPTEAPKPFVPGLLAPSAAQTNVAIRPTFQWANPSDFNIGTDQYRLMVADNMAFTAPKISRDLLTTNSYISELDLDYGTAYYWRVQAVKVVGSTKTAGPWVSGVFTTMGKPEPTIYTAPDGMTFNTRAELEAYLKQLYAPKPVTTPVYIWVIIAIGAILVIAVIVLIVRTRRVP